MHLVLVGFMGTGKSTVGRLAAQKLDRSFYDMDAVIEERVGKTVARIFAEDGEATFRRLESTTLRELLARTPSLVIATGGGVLLDTSNRDLLENQSVMICLTARVDTLTQRLQRSRNRPLLEGAELTERIETLLRERESLYASCSHQVSTDEKSLNEVTEDVVKVFQSHTAS